MNNMKTIFPLAVLVLLGACKAHDQAAAPVASSAPGTAVATTPDAGSTAMLGKWTGPEGTFLLVEKKDGKLAVTVQNLDGPRVFTAQSDGKQLTFVRDGKTLALTPTDGAGTGMKWLAGRKQCIVVEPGEGYCRD